MIKRVLLLIVVLFSTVSPCLHARSAMEDLRGYTEYLRKALLQGDQPNIEAYSEALTELVLEAQVTGKFHERRYAGVLLEKQIKAAMYGFVRK